MQALEHGSQVALPAHSPLRSMGNQVLEALNNM